ncbi:MAG TPA: hypothetical protein VFJ90_00490 [Candidatus Didemnitutus sp.]|nr:hypothetical protein [Candidatus Didemnitutus sp.]
MNYSGAVALLVCSTGVVLSALALQFINTTLHENERIRLPSWLVVIALLFAGVAIYALRSFSFPDGRFVGTLALTAVMLAGVGFKWLCETVAQKKLVLHEAALARALLVAPLIVVCLGDSAFAPQIKLGAFLLWFLNGYFWHTLFSDIERITTRERVVIRRREPPIPPRDFEKPNIE